MAPKTLHVYFSWLKHWFSLSMNLSSVTTSQHILVVKEVIKLHHPIYSRGMCLKWNHYFECQCNLTDKFLGIPGILHGIRFCKLLYFLLICTFWMVIISTTCPLLTDNVKCVFTVLKLCSWKKGMSMWYYTYVNLFTVCTLALKIIYEILCRMVWQWIALYDMIPSVNL